MSSEERGRSSYLDLLITTLMEHEKTLDAIVEKIEKISEDLRGIYAEASSKPEKTVAVKTSTLKEKAKTTPSEPDTLVYMRIKLDRVIDDVVKIIETLKE
jgi:aconitase B